MARSGAASPRGTTTARSRRAFAGDLPAQDASAPRPRWLELARAVVGSRFAPAGLVLLLYGGWFAGYLVEPHHDIRDFIHVGRSFINRSHASAVIKLDPTYRRYEQIGYDGQFAYYIALDPVHAAAYMDYPESRYSRILYPALAWLVALGQSGLVPLAMVLVNLAAITVGVGALGAWLARRGHSAWFALVFGFYPGIFIALTRDLTEVLAYSLVAVALFLLDLGGRRGLVLGSLAFVLATLAKDAALIFAGTYAVAMVWSARHDRAALRRILLAAGAIVVPFLVLRLGFMAWLGPGSLVGLATIPLGGILSWRPWDLAHELEVVGLVVPAMLLSGMAGYALYRGSRSVELGALIMALLVSVIFLPQGSWVDYAGASRIAAAVPLAAVLCLPLFTRVSQDRWWLWSSAGLWLWPMLFWLVVPLLDLLRGRPGGPFIF